MSLVYQRPGQLWIDHTFDVPLDHRDPAGPAIEVFARELVARDRAGHDLPWLLFLQGGPGCQADRPTSSSAWLSRALRDFRVVLLDQRGTGRSSPMTRQTMARFADPAAVARHLRHFRADAIVRDAELVRRKLIGDRPWTLLGQSFGGFCAMTYLSQAPDGLSEVLIAGGVPSLTAHADEVYRAAYPRMLAHNERFFARYPGDRAVARAIAHHLAEHDVRLPGGERFTPQRFQMLGTMLGGGRFDDLHFLLEDALGGKSSVSRLSDAFLRGADAVLSHAEKPLYAVMQESIYCQSTASGWSAHRLMAEFPEFELASGRDVYFLGEMVYPWLIAEDPALSAFRECADLLAAVDDWPPLYDPDRLSRNPVPVAAAIYHDDLYVDRVEALRTAAAVRELRPWVTSEHPHDALTRDARVFDRLLAMARGLG